MGEPPFTTLRADIAAAVRQPEFRTVRRRATHVRRRRTATTAVALIATVLSATGLAHTIHQQPDDTPVTGGTPARMTTVTATGAELYGVLVDCGDCASHLYATPDGGTTWQRRTEPPTPADAETPRAATLIPLGPHTIAWRERRGIPRQPSAPASTPTVERYDPANQPPPDHLWITGDGGRTWRPVTTDTSPAGTIPENTTPADCNQLQIPTCVLGVIDPTTGRAAPLATQPTGINVRWPGSADQVTAPPGGRLWIPGQQRATGEPAIATSADGGRTWHTHVFTDTPRTGQPRVPGPPKLAAGPGATAYALTYHLDRRVDTHYTADGGRTWRAGTTIPDARPNSAFVTPDGTLIVKTAAGFVAGRGTGPYTPVNLPGYPHNSGQQVLITAPTANQPYLLPDETGPHLSPDGRTWHQIKLP